jgi:hypothetical protein
MLVQKERRKETQNKCNFGSCKGPFLSCLSLIWDRPAISDLYLKALFYFMFAQKFLLESSTRGPTLGEGIKMSDLAIHYYKGLTLFF